MRSKPSSIRSMIITLLLCPALLSGQGADNPGSLVAGYETWLHGEKFSYHSLRPDVSDAMLVRAMGRELYIEWETAPAPADIPADGVTFIIMANINVREDDPHSWDILIDGAREFTITTPSSRELVPVTMESESGCLMKFTPVEVDKYGDLMGYIYFTVPAGKLVPGKRVVIRAVGESANSRSFFIVYRYTMTPGLSIIPEQAIRRDGKKLFQQVRVVSTYMGTPGKAVIEAGGVTTPASLQFGYNSIVARIPVVEKDTPFRVSVRMGKKTISSGEFTVTPVIPRTVHLLHHSHVDIGYTHVQSEVEKIQWQHLENAIKLAEESRDNPEGERFKWNSEVMWAVSSYLRAHPGEKGDALKRAIVNGDIETGATFAHMLSELCNTEELIQVTADARRLEAMTGIVPEAAMITDVPGWSWGLVPVLAETGTRYLSLGTNHGHRIGTIMEERGDRPFWWVSPSGEHKLLCWVHLNGYSMFHTGVSDNIMSVDLISGKIFGYLNQLYQRDYPYEIVPARYSIGADNGPTDPGLASLVKEWNSIFVTPVLKISTVSETFREFEERYGDDIPVVRGAFTGYWEDGAASSALMTGLNRQAAGNVNIASSLAVIKGYKKDISEELKDLWRNVMLYDEHTWGSWNSISDPEDEFTLSQWRVKSSFARSAALESIRLRDNILGIDPGWRSATREAGEPLSEVEVINTHSWDITQPVEIPASWNPAGYDVYNEKGELIPSQLLSTGNLCFIATAVPATGSSVYFLRGSREADEVAVNEGNVISNNLYEITADRETGAISRIIDRRTGRELADSDKLPGINSAWYVKGRSPANRSTSSNAKVRITDDGPIVKVIETESELEGCNGIISRYTLVEGLERIYVSTIIDKKLVYDQEGLHIAFPFKVPDPEVNIDLALGVYRPGADQARGACMNYYTAEHWIDVSNKDFGVTLTSLDAPLFELGDITTDATATGWITNATSSSTIYSYVMNNYWETNYLAGQEGLIPFRYVITPHGPFNAGWSERTAVAEAERLVVVPGTKAEKGAASLFTAVDNSIIATAIIPAEGGYLIRLFNADGAPSRLEIKWKREPAEVWFTDLDGNRISDYKDGVIVPAWGLRTVRVVEQ